VADEQVRIDITATDDASKVIDDVAGETKKLEESDPTVDVGADSDAAAKALAEVKEWTKDVDALSPTVDVTVDSSKAKGGIDEITESTGKAKDAVHGFVGEAAVELPGVADAVGPAGEAIGQMTEGLLAGEIAMGELVAAALPLVALTVGFKLISGYLGDIEATKAFHRDQVDKWVTALKEGKTVIGAIKDDIKETAKIEFISSGDVKDATGSLDRLKLTADDFLEAIKDPAALQAWRDQRDAVDENVDRLMQARTALQGAFGPEQQQELERARQKLKDYNSVIDAAEQKIKDTGTATEETERLTRVYGDTATRTKSDVDDLTFAQGELTKKVDATKWAFDELRGGLSFEAAVNNLQTQLETALTNISTGAGVTRDDILAIKQSIIDVGEQAGKTPVEIEAELQKVTPDNLWQIASDVQSWYAKNPAKIQADLVLRSKTFQVIGGGGGLSVTIPPQVGGTAAPGVVNVNLPRGYRGNVVAEVTGATRRNGRRYGAPAVRYARR
jgi:hypothetical protein